jgi:hypothetical protein
MRHDHLPQQPWARHKRTIETKPRHVFFFFFFFFFFVVSAGELLHSETGEIYTVVYEGGSKKTKVEGLDAAATYSFFVATVASEGGMQGQIASFVTTTIEDEEDEDEKALLAAAAASAEEGEDAESEEDDEGSEGDDEGGGEEEVGGAAGCVVQ